MNTILLEANDFVAEDRVRLRGRRRDHVCNVMGAAIGDEFRVGVVNGKLGLGRIEQVTDEAFEMTVTLDRDPPPPLPFGLILALPRPKVLNRTIAAAASMGIREIHLINAWRVEKSYWKSPRMTAENLRLQCILGLEQAGDTKLPTIHMHRLFVPFVRDDIPKIVDGKLALVAHPGGGALPRRNADEPFVLAIGPEGGFIDREVESFRDAGFIVVSSGPRILRVETALAFFAGRLTDDKQLLRP